MWLHIWRLTVVHAENDSSSEKTTNCLKKEVHGELSPGLSSKQAKSKGHCRVQMAA